MIVPKIVTICFESPINRNINCNNGKKNSKKMDGFKAIRLRSATLKRFKRFSLRVAKTYSDALDAMIDFFTWHDYVPSDRFGTRNSKQHEHTQKRVEALIAIVRDIEKNNDKPNTAMLQLLFEGSAEDEEQALLDSTYASLDNEEPTQEIESVPIAAYQEMEAKLVEAKKKIGELLEQLTPVKNRFGTDYLKLEISIQELIKLKRTINKI